MSRTIVVSDLHGNARLLTGVLEHAGFSDGDRLVIAGDLVDVGTDDTIALADALGATVLAGNHEVAAAIGLQISPQNPETRLLAPELARRFASGEWPLALAVDGWLITHAGVSTALSDITDRFSGDAEQIADALNHLFRDEIASAVRRMPVSFQDLDRYRLIGGEMGPLWFRPLNMGHIPSGLRQVVGHTPPDALPEHLTSSLERHGWLLVEPGGHAGGRGSAGDLRYAVLQNGAGRIVTG